MASTSEPKFIFDYQKLKASFVEICPDFVNEPSFEHSTTSRLFSNQVIFEFSKEAKAAKAQKKEKSWTVNFQKKYKLIISTYAFTQAPKHQPTVLNNSLHLSFKQASLLAVSKYCQLVPHLVKRDQIVLTPLAGAVFSKEDIHKLAAALNEPLADVIIAIVSSCQTDGYYLEHSQCHIALVALAKTIKDVEMRESLMKKTVKMYELYGKKCDMAKFELFNQFSEHAGSKVKNKDDADQLVAQLMAISMGGNANDKIPSRKARGPVEIKCAAKFDAFAK